ncbi:MAG: DUF4421 domain-containing protein [Bacteroides sp.]|nr:DUF4421 domain-containing protein [Bacteroides sp.]MCM1095623.1 DUF4421 domain-containing protein [Terasakiella sp.]
MQRFAAIIISVMVGLSAMSAGAMSFNLDSIAAKGAFPRAIVKIYRWGDGFFNPRDSAYVDVTGTKFSVKLNTQSWLNHLNFRINSRETIDLRSDPSTTMGIYITYLALTAGYDINVSKLFGRSGHARQRYQFGFNCSLMSAEAYWERNTVGTKLRRFGETGGLDLPFDGASFESWGLDIYYFFNHRRYSQAALFAYSRIQRRSQGSFYAGLSTYTQQYDIDFSSLPAEMLSTLPEWWADSHYRVRTRNFGLRVGYGFNWVLPHGWTIGASASPVVGVATGKVNSDNDKVRFSLYNHIKLGAVWNHERWFIGAQGLIDTAVVEDHETLFLGSNVNFNAVVGYRFNLW